jgi:hypothetical protein
VAIRSTEKCWEAVDRCGRFQWLRVDSGSGVLTGRVLEVVSYGMGEESRKGGESDGRWIVGGSNGERTLDQSTRWVGYPGGCGWIEWVLWVAHAHQPPQIAISVITPAHMREMGTRSI